MAIDIQLHGAAPGTYLNTKAYLRGSATAVQIIDALERMDEKLVVRVWSGTNEKVGSLWDVPDRLYSGGIIRWWIYDWTKVPLDIDVLGFQTPGIALIHEMGHAYQYFFTNMKKEIDAKNKAFFASSRNRHKETVEADNVLHYESKVAQQLDEPIRRNYTDNIEMDVKECLAKGLPDYMR